MKNATELLRFMNCIAEIAPGQQLRCQPELHAALQSTGETLGLLVPHMDSTPDMAALLIQALCPAFQNRKELSLFLAVCFAQHVDPELRNFIMQAVTASAAGERDLEQKLRTAELEKLESNISKLQADLDKPVLN